MEKDEKLEKILSDLRKDWSEWQDKPAKEIEKSLKKVVVLTVPNYCATIEEFENISNRGRQYKRLTDEQKKEVDKEYEKKINQIKRFLGSLAGVIVKKNGLERSEQIMRTIANALEKENYFGAINLSTISDEAFKWIVHLYSHYLVQISEKSPIRYNGLSERIRKELFSNSTIDEWSKYLQDEDFDGLSKWVKEFVDSINKNMINESKRDVEYLKNRIDPKFYLVKEQNDCAIVYNETGQLYVFPKGKAAILYPEGSEVNSQDFKRIRKINPTSFPEFYPEEW